MSADGAVEVRDGRRRPRRRAVVGATALLLGVVVLSAPPAAGASGVVPGFVRSWGTIGSGAGEFNRPEGIATDSSGNVYVVDRGNDRIQKFDSSGNFLTSWGTAAGSGHLADPLAVSVDAGGTVYVLDSGKVLRFGSTGTFIGSWTGSLVNPFDLAVDGAGNVFVLDTNSGSPSRAIRRYSSAGVLAIQWNVLLASSTVGVRPDGTEVYVGETHFEVGTTQGSVQRYSATGTSQGEMGIVHGWGSQLGIGVGSDNIVYVSDSESTCQGFPCNVSHGVTSFTSAGAELGDWGGKGSANGQFLSPGDVAPGPNGTVYVADTGNNRVQQFSSVPGLSITKSADQTTVLAGDDIDYHLTVTNTGNVDLTGVTVTDTNAPDCAETTGSLAIGAHTTIDCTYTTVLADGGTYTNTATADSDQTTPATSNQVDVTVTARTPAIDYHLTVTNTGNVDLTGVTVTDADAPDCAETTGSLAIGAHTTIDCTYTTVLADGGTYTNTAIADSDQTTPATSNQVDVTVTAPTCRGETVTVALADGATPTIDADVILGTAGDDTVDALAGDDRFCGLTGDDAFVGGPGADIAFGGPGADTLSGGDRGDLLVGGSGADVVRGGNGADTLNGRGDDDLLTGGNGADTLNGGAGTDICRGRAGTDIGLACETSTGIP